MREKQTILNNSFKEFKMHICLVTKVIEEFEEKYEEFENKIWRNTSIHSMIPFFTMNESINK